MPVLLVFGATSASRPWRRRVTRELDGLRPDVVEHARRYPTEESVGGLADAGRACGAGIVVAVGGGSVLDAAKIARARLAAERAEGAPALVTVPTTPGTGAEVTPFATVWDFERSKKESVASLEVRPTAAVVDPELTATMDRREYGSSALDALVQGVEAAWSTRSTAESIALGLTAAGLVREAYEAAVQEPENLGACTAISLAGLHSGRAIAISQTTACHAISYPLTLMTGLRHGHACSLPLGQVLAYNARAGDCMDARGPEHVRGVVRRILRALGVCEPREVEAVLESFRRLAGLEEWSEVELDAASVAALRQRTVNFAAKRYADMMFVSGLDRATADRHFRPRAVVVPAGLDTRHARFPQRSLRHHGLPRRSQGSARRSQSWRLLQQEIG